MVTPLITTSYFAKYRGDSGCNIALKPIKGWSGKCYPPLYPTWEILSTYKNGGTEEDYIRLYNNILKKLDPLDVLNDLQDMTLLCYESPGKFCHRRLVAVWLQNELGIYVPEIIYNNGN